MFIVKSNAYFGAETQTEDTKEHFEDALLLAGRLHARGNLRDVWVSKNGRVLWHNGKVEAPKLSGPELYKELTEALRAERQKADLAGYYQGETGPKQEYEQAQARTNSLINQIFMEG